MTARRPARRPSRPVDAVCPRCGHQPVPGGLVTVIQPAVEEDHGRWGFVCPSCAGSVWHIAPVEVRRFLRSRGALMVPESAAPAPQPVLARPVFTEADAKAFAAQLDAQDAAWIIARCQPRGGGAR